MNLSSFVGNRLSLKRDSRRSSAGVVIAVSGIAISFVVMLLAIAVVTGFKKEIIHKLTGFNADITVLPAVAGPDAVNPGPIHYSDSLQDVITEVIPGAEVTLAINQPAVFKTDSTFQGVILRGLDRHSAWDFVKENLTEGTETNGLVISRHTADALGVKAGEKLMTHFFDGSNIRSRNLPIKGIYESHFSDFDNSIAFIPIAEIQKIFDVDSLTATSIEIRGVENKDIDRLSETLYQTLLAYSMNGMDETGSQKQFYRVENLNTQCSLYINWLSLLDTNVVVILVLMVLVSCFTLISSLFIIILERVNMIGMFKAMGATNLQIRRIFIYMAQRLVVRGLLIGNVIGIGIILLQTKFRLFPLDADAYYLSFVPMDISWLTVILLNLGVIVMAWLILILPSLLISTLSPARSIRYE